MILILLSIVGLVALYFSGREPLARAVPVFALADALFIEMEIVQLAYPRMDVC